jgi:hypothetical protein
MEHLRNRAALLAIAMVTLVATQVRAEDPTWSFRVATGLFVSVGHSADLDPVTSVDISRAAPMVSVDVIRTLDCCVELWISGTVPWIPVDVTVNGTAYAAGRISPAGLQVGMNYAIWHRDTVEVLVGTFLGGFAADRSEAVTAGGRTTAYHFPGSWGLGGTFGVRKKLDDRFKIDATLRWQQAHLPAGENDRIFWDPLALTGGLTMRLW